MKSAQLGTFVIGQAYGPTSGVANIKLSGAGVVVDTAGNDWNKTSIQGFNLEVASAHQAIAYISPTIAGFTFAAAWSDLDYDAAANGSSSSATDAWEVALRYAGEFGPIRIAGGIGYTALDDGDDVNPDGAQVMGSVALMHTPTGLNVAFAAGTEIDNGAGPLNKGDITTDAQFWHVHGGISQNFFGMGKTSLYGEYASYDYDESTLSDEDEVTMWGLGLVQNFDSAATELFIAYRVWDAENANGVAPTTADGDVQQIMAGARIKF